MRKGFGLIMAIMFIVLVATIGALALSFSTQTSKQTSDVYLRAQAELLSRSATEYALLAISAHDIIADGNCINTITANDGNFFNINITLQYIGNGLPCNIVGLAGVTRANNIATTDSNPTVLIDTIVTSAIALPNGEPIRIHRRTLQKP